MNRLELIEKFRTRTNVSKKEASTIVKTIFDEIANALVRGDRVEIRDLFSMKIRYYKGREGMNPKTGEKFQMPPRKRPYLKAGKKVFDIINS